MYIFDLIWWLDFGIITTRAIFAVFSCHDLGYLQVRYMIIFSHDIDNLSGDNFQSE